MEIKVGEKCLRERIEEQWERIDKLEAENLELDKIIDLSKQQMDKLQAENEKLKVKIAELEDKLSESRKFASDMNDLASSRFTDPSDGYAG